MNNYNLKLSSEWKNVLKEEFNKKYFSDILEFLKKELEDGKKIYPSLENIFNALNKTSFDNLKVVILGQDPYHGENQAHGLSFSVPFGVTPPPSLKNIYKEIESDLNIKINKEHGNLEKWSLEGVLLLNSILSVEASKPASHSKIGWETFTDNIIKTISDKKKGIVFILWGNFAKSKKKLIDCKKHYILESPHPSPFSAYNGFFGCKHFSKTNQILKNLGKKEIDWKL